MTFQEAFETEKDTMRTQAAAASSMEELAEIAVKTLDRMHYRVQEETEEALLPLASELTETAKAAAYFADTAGEVKLWERTVKKQDPEKKGSRRTGAVFGWVLLLVSVLSFGAAFVFASSSDAAFLAALTQERTLALIGASLISLFFSGWLIRPVKNMEKETERKSEILPDAGKYVRIFSALALTMDAQMEEARERMKLEDMRREQEGAAAIGEEEAALFSELLAAYESGDGAYAAEKIGDVKFYLHKKGIETVSYSAETAQYFDLLPSPGSGTIRPALVKDGSLIRKGIAAGGM